MLNKEKIRELQRQGYGYKKIASLLCLPVNTVKSHIRRHPIDLSKKTCLYCDKVITNTPHKREKKYCSDKCRLAWWREHQDLVNRKAIYHLTCKNCGKSFESYGNARRIYCSRACYANARRKEA